MSTQAEAPGASVPPAMSLPRKLTLFEHGLTNTSVVLPSPSLAQVVAIPPVAAAVLGAAPLQPRRATQTAIEPAQYSEIACFSVRKRDPSARSDKLCRAP